MPMIQYIEIPVQDVDDKVFSMVYLVEPCKKVLSHRITVRILLV